MIIKKINREEARKKLEIYFKGDEHYFDKLNNDYLTLRQDLLDLFYDSLNYKKSGKIDEYPTDLNFSAKLYEYFNNKDWFNISVASDFDFWYYICVCVVPDLIEERHGNVVEYFYAKNVRMYIPTLWWYFHMAYQVDINTTKNILLYLNTDYILQIVERPGKDGIYLEIFREIIRVLSTLTKVEREKKVNKKNLLRRVMIQNTAMIDNYNLVFDGNAKLYVEKLFLECGVEI